MHVIIATALPLLLLALKLMLPFPEVTLPPEFKGVDISGSTSAVSTLKLRDQHEQVRSLRDCRGKAVLLYFGFTHCRDGCSTVLGDMAQVVRHPLERLTRDPSKADTRELLGAVFIFDRDGRPRLYVDVSKRPVEAITHDVRLLLHE